MNLSSFFLSCFLLIVSMPLAALQWPVQSVNLKASFGQLHSGFVLGGVLLSGSGQELRPVSDGKIVYHSNQYRTARTLPSADAGYLVVEHQGRMRSLYANFKPLPFTKNADRITAADVFGVTGSFHPFYQESLFVSISRMHAHRFLNPLIVLPSVPDEFRPQIRGIYLGVEENEPQLLVNDTEIPAGAYPVYIDAFDTKGVFRNTVELAPYGFYLFLNNELVITRFLDDLNLENTTAVSRNIPYHERSILYNADSILSLGKLHLLSGENLLELLVVDFSGNEMSRTVRFRVQ